MHEGPATFMSRMHPRCVRMCEDDSRSLMLTQLEELLNLKCPLHSFISGRHHLNAATAVQATADNGHVGLLHLALCKRCAQAFDGRPGLCHHEESPCRRIQPVHLTVTNSFMSMPGYVGVLLHNAMSHGHCCWLSLVFFLTSRLSTLFRIC